MSNFSVEDYYAPDDFEIIKKVIDLDIDKEAVYESIRNQLSNSRVGTASVKSRGEVIGSNKKPWAQKGTGRARAGTVKSPLWRGGGCVFPPKPRSYSYSLSVNVKRRALLCLLSDFFSQGRVVVVKDFYSRSSCKIRDFIDLVKGYSGNFLSSQGFLGDITYNDFNKIARKYRFLFLLDKKNLFIRSKFSNISWVDFLIFDNLNIYKLFYSHLIFLDKSLLYEMLNYYLIKFKNGKN